MDSRDLSILRVLDADARASYSAIAKQTRLSKETVKYRVERLENESILLGYWALPKIGNNFHVYKVFLKHKGLTAKEKEDFESFVSRAPETSWFAKTTGSWTYILTLMSQQDWKISELLAQIFEHYGSKFSDIQLIKSIKAISMNEKYLFEKPLVRGFTDNFLEEPVALNETESNILALLVKNARARYTDMAQMLGLTSEAISHSFRQLSKKKAIIDLKPRINHAKLGFSYYHLMVSLSEGRALHDIEQYCIADKNSVFTMRHVGKYQIHIELVSKSEEIDDIVDNLLDTFSSVISGYDLCKIEHEFKIRVNK